MTLLRKLRKSLDRMIKNLIIQFRQLEILWLDFLKKVPIGLGVFDSSDCESAFASCKLLIRCGGRKRFVGRNCFSI